MASSRITVSMGAVSRRAFHASASVGAQENKWVGGLQQVLKSLQNTLTFHNGVLKTHTLKASDKADDGFGKAYRPSPGSVPQARIPQGPAERAYDIKYFSRDVRRNADPSSLSIEASFPPEYQKLIAGPALVEQPQVGSPGIKNPDVERYDKTGLRSAMTATAGAMRREIHKNRENHISTPAWTKDDSTLAWWKQQEAAGLMPSPGKPTLKRLGAWQYTHSGEW